MNRKNMAAIYKTTILLLLISISSFAQIKPDKYYHAGAGVTISAGVYTIGQYSYREMNPIAPSLVAFTAGAFKEFYDSMRGGQFSNEDLLFTTASGIATNIIMNIIWKRKKGRKVKKDPFDEYALKKAIE